MFVEGITNEDGLLTKSDTKALITTLFVNEFNGENLMNEEIDEMARALSRSGKSRRKSVA